MRITVRQFKRLIKETIEDVSQESPQDAAERLFARAESVGAVKAAKKQLRKDLRSLDSDQAYALAASSIWDAIPDDDSLDDPEVTHYIDYLIDLELT